MRARLALAAGRASRAARPSGSRSGAGAGSAAAAALRARRSAMRGADRRIGLELLGRRARRASSGTGATGPPARFWNEAIRLRIGSPCWLATTRRLEKLRPSRSRLTRKSIGMLVAAAAQEVGVQRMDRAVVGHGAPRRDRAPGRSPGRRTRGRCLRLWRRPMKRSPPRGSRSSSRTRSATSCSGVGAVRDRHCRAPCAPSWRQSTDAGQLAAATRQAIALALLRAGHRPGGRGSKPQRRSSAVEGARVGFGEAPLAAPGDRQRDRRHRARS